MALMGKPIIPCARTAETQDLIRNYADALESNAHLLGSHGLSEEEFKASGIFGSAIEILRGRQAATTVTKRAFVEAVLNYMKDSGVVSKWTWEGGRNRYDYSVTMGSDHTCIIETKGCLDGNNANIFERPHSADEFLIWSLCQSPGSDMRKNAWSGISTRLVPEEVLRQQQVDSVVIWDMLCGSALRPCPKLIRDSERATPIPGYTVPPPCIYLFPRRVPHVRSNPHAPAHSIDELPFSKALHTLFKGLEPEIYYVSVDVRTNEGSIERKLTVQRGGEVIIEGKWAVIKRGS